MSKEIWRKDYDEFYQERLNKGTQVYGHEQSKKFILTRTNLNKGKGTLIDIGCGDGTWSVILAEWYDVTAVDNCKIGIECCKVLNKKYKTNVNFIYSDIANITDKYDVVWCRCPEFFGGYAPETEIFQKYLKITMNLCKKYYYFIVCSKPPFSIYANEQKTSYYHDPEILKNIFSNFGKVELSYQNKYIVIKIIINEDRSDI